MSRDCSKWCWDTEIKPATLKLTLLSLCDRADNDGYRCYPSIERIAKDTGLNKKTVQQNIKKLIDLGYVRDTGGRVGKMKRVRILQVTPNVPKSGIDNVPENGVINDTENGLHNQSVESVSIITEDNADHSQLVHDSFHKAFWPTWSEAKKKCESGVGPKAETFEKKWKPLFNATYFKNKTEQDFRGEVESICKFVESTHKQEGFNRFTNMYPGRFFSEKQWRD